MKNLITTLLLLVTLTSCAQFSDYSRQRACLKDLDTLKQEHSEDKLDLRIEWLRRDITTEQYKSIVVSWKKSEDAQRLACSSIF